MQATASFVFCGVPSFFRACCFEAACQHDRLNYANAGYHLMLHVEGLIPYDALPDEWDLEIQRLHALLESESVDLIIAWFVDRFPRCMVLVPSRRRVKFVEGVIKCWLVNDFGETFCEAEEQAKAIVGLA